jgi:hypothetical protein
MPQRIQTVLFAKATWTAARARVWLKGHTLRSDKLDEGAAASKFMRFRQFDPAKCKGAFLALTRGFPAGVQATSCNVPAGAATEAAELLPLTYKEALLVQRQETCSATEQVQEAGPRAQLCSNVLAVQEAKYDKEKRLLPVRIIKAGLNTSRSRFYPAAVLERDYRIFEGLKMFANHATEEEQRRRPEGDVWNWVGNIQQVHYNKEAQAIDGVAAIIDDGFDRRLQNLAQHGLLHEMGLSIRALGEGEDAHVEVN